MALETHSRTLCPVWQIRGKLGSSASCPSLAEPLQHGSESPVELNSVQQSLALLSKIGSAMLSKVPRPDGRACHNARQQLSWHRVDKYSQLFPGCCVRLRKGFGALDLSLDIWTNRACPSAVLTVLWPKPACFYLSPLGEKERI